MIPILLYHRIAQVTPAEDPKGLSVSPEKFENQMSYLYKKGYRSVALVEAVKYFRKNLRQPKRTFAITFDDGYQDLYSTVWPILDRFGFTATVFFVAGRSGRASDWEGQSGSCAAQLLSWAEACELVRAGFTFGSHAVTHMRLKTLKEEQVRDEIQRSKSMMENQLGAEVNLFSYPYSDFDTRIQKIVAETGYIAACGGEKKTWSLFNLWRAQCTSKDNISSFSIKASGWYHKFIWLREQSQAGPYLLPIGRGLKRIFRSAKHRNSVDSKSYT